MEPQQSNANLGGPNSGGTSSTGTIIAIIIILAIIVLGGLYFWGQRDGNDLMNYGGDQMQSETDDTSSIEADLNSTDVENVDAEVNAS